MVGSGLVLREGLGLGLGLRLGEVRRRANDDGDGAGDDGVIAKENTIPQSVLNWGRLDMKGERIYL